MSERHVLLGRGAPAYAPTALGQQYYNIRTEDHYLGIGLAGVEDWVGPFILESKISDLVGVPPITMNTLEKIALALGNDPDYYTSLLAKLDLKLDLAFESTMYQFVDDAVLSGGGGEVTAPVYSSVFAIDVQSYTLQEADMDKYGLANHTDPIVIRLPMNAWGSFPEVHIEQTNVGSVSFTPDEGVTLLYLDILEPSIAGQGGVVTLKQVALNTWIIFGGLLLATLAAA